MRTRTATALAIVAGFGVGALTVQGLHAQAKPAPLVYVVTEIDVKNLPAYEKEYAPLARASIKKYGGRLLAAGQNVTSLEGQPPKPRVAINVFDGLDKVKTWRNSADYKDARKTGNKYATFRSFAVEGVPQ